MLGSFYGNIKLFGARPHTLVNVSTKKGGACRFRNEPRSISASCVWPSGPNARPHMALMHDMSMEQHCCRGENYEASSTDNPGRRSCPGDAVGRHRPTG